jgi:hypothetical protein
LVSLELTEFLTALETSRLVRLHRSDSESSIDYYVLNYTYVSFSEKGAAIMFCVMQLLFPDTTQHGLSFVNFA